MTEILNTVRNQFLIQFLVGNNCYCMCQTPGADQVAKPGGETWANEESAAGHWLQVSLCHLFLLWTMIYPTVQLLWCIGIYIQHTSLLARHTEATSLSLESDSSIMECGDDRTAGGLATSGSLVVSGSVWRGTGAQWTGDKPCQTPESRLQRTSAGQPWCLHRKTSAGPCHNSPKLRSFPAGFAWRPGTLHAGRCAKQKDDRYEAPRTTSSCFGPVWHPCPGPSSPCWRRPRLWPRQSSSGRQLPSNSEWLWQESSPEHSTPYQTEEDAPELNWQSLRRTCPAPLRSLWSGYGKTFYQSPWALNLKWNHRFVDDMWPCISVTVNKCVHTKKWSEAHDRNSNNRYFWHYCHQPKWTRLYSAQHAAARLSLLA